MKLMRRVLLLLVVMLPAVVSGQQWNLTVPISRASVAKVRIKNFNCTDLPQCVIDLVYQDSSDNVLTGNGVPSTQFTVPSAAGSPCTSATTFGALMGAMKASRSGEPAGNAAAMSYRILGYLSDQGCFAAGSLNQ